MGIGESSKVMLIAVGVFFPIYLNIVSGIQGVDRKLIEVGKIYHFTSFQIVRRIIFTSFSSILSRRLTQWRRFRLDVRRSC